MSLINELVSHLQFNVERDNDTVGKPKDDMGFVNEFDDDGDEEKFDESDEEEGSSRGPG